MSFITPARAFEGGDMANQGATKLIKETVPTISFNEGKNKSGIYLFVMPPYKSDAIGQGVWYKVITVRDNFGMDTFKERFVEREDSPIAWFQRQVKAKYPKFAEVAKMQKDGKDWKVFPPYGRTTKRVLFNVAYANDLNAGVFVLDVPSYGCADVIDAYHRRPGFDGALPPLVCDPAQACPVFFKLNKDGVGNPWQVAVEGGKRFALPDQLASKLFNLDDVCIMHSNEDLLNKLRSVVPPELFNDCMQGYAGISNVAASITTTAPTAANPMMAAPVAAPAAPVIASAASFNLAPPTIAAPAVANLAASAFNAVPVQKEVVAQATNPMQQSPEAIKKWLQQ